MAVKYRADEYLSPRSLLIAATVMMGLLILCSVVSIGSSVLQWELLNRMATGGDWTHAEADQNDLREMAVGLVWLLVYVFTAIPFLKLLGRLNHNAWWFGVREMRFTPGWTIGWFFVPIMNLFKPVQAVQDIAKISKPGGDRWEWMRRPNNGLVGSWWGLWILSTILGQVSMRMARAEELSMIQAATVFDIAVQVVEIVLSCVALLMVRQLAAWQETKYESGERYDRAELKCANCGEPYSLAIGNCSMCGAKLAAADEFAIG